MNPPGGCEHAKFSRKLHEIERIWTPRGGRASLTPPLDPPMNGVLACLWTVTKNVSISQIPKPKCVLGHS